MVKQDEIIAGIVGAGTAAGMPDELMHWALKILLGALTGVLTAGLTSLAKKLYAKVKKP